MGIFHFLNVNDGDCSIIQHPSRRVTMIDVCNASSESSEAADEELRRIFAKGVSNQKGHPVNPLAYLKLHNINSLFRFVVTHPDMDHIDGIEDLFSEFSPYNIWDTDNKKETTFTGIGRYKESDWLYYRRIRNGTNTASKRLELYSGASGTFFNKNADNDFGGDGLHILSPTPELIKEAKSKDDYNDSSYVILYRSNGGKILLAGDSHDATWEHLMENHKDDISDIDVLVAPHHGRKSGRSYEFLDVVNPRLTLFGNAPSDHLAYNAWNYRGLPFITNNQADCIIIDTNQAPMKVYVTNQSYAEKINPNASFDYDKQAYFCHELAQHGVVV